MLTPKRQIVEKNEAAAAMKATATGPPMVSLESWVRLEIQMPLPGVRWSTPKSDAGLWHEAGESHTLNGGGDGGEQRVAAGGRATAKRFPARAAEGAVVVVAYCGAAALTSHWQPLCWRNLSR